MSVTETFFALVSYRLFNRMEACSWKLVRKSCPNALTTLARLASPLRAVTEGKMPTRRAMILLSNRLMSY